MRDNMVVIGTSSDGYLSIFLLPVNENTRTRLFHLPKDQFVNFSELSGVRSRTYVDSWAT